MIKNRQRHPGSHSVTKLIDPSTEMQHTHFDLVMIVAFFSLLNPKLMKELKKLFVDRSNGGCGSVTLLTEEPEDAWHLFNLAIPGDTIRASTIRKVKIDKGSVVIADKKHVTLTLKIEKTDYDGQGGVVRFTGINIEENPYVKMGQYHTIEITASDAEKLTLSKNHWDSISLETLAVAINPTKAAEVVVLLIDDNGTAGLYALTSVLARDLWKVQISLPRKGTRKQFEDFYRSIQKAVVNNVNFDVVSCLVIAGPGFAPENFLEFVTSPYDGDTQLAKNKSVFVLGHCSGAYKHCIEELLNDNNVKGKIANTRAAEHAKALDKFYKRLQNEPDRACYGLIPVSSAVEEGAVEELFVTDKLFRSANAIERKKYVSLVDKVKKSNGLVLVFSEQHTTGQQLSQLSGLAALLRYEIPDE